MIARGFGYCPPGMNVALVTDAWRPQVNGVVTTLEHVCDELRRRGDRVLTITPLDFRTLPCPRYREIRLSVRPLARVSRELDAFTPDAIHIATEGPLGIAARRYCLRRHIPFTTSYHTQFPLYLEHYAKIPRAIGYRLVRWFHGPARSTLVPTPSVRNELASRGLTNLRVWTRGVDTELFRPRDDVAPAGAPPVSIYVGRVAVEKNVEAFLDADIPGTKVVVGEGPALPALRRRHPEARFVGYLHGEELARELAAADVFVFPSRTDTFGVVMLEAMACGVPVAAYPVTGPVDVVVDGVTGALDEDLGVAARRALGARREECRAHALTYSWERCAAIFADNLAHIERSARGASVPATV